MIFVRSGWDPETRRRFPEMFRFCPEIRPWLPETRRGRPRVLVGCEGLLELRFIAERFDGFLDIFCAVPTGRPEERKSDAPVLSKNRRAGGLLGLLPEAASDTSVSE